MGFGDRLKSWFIIEEESSKKVTSKNKPKANKKSNTSAESAPKKASNPATATSEPGKITTKFMEILLAAMDKKNLDGFDYLEFKQSLKSLEKMPMDEATRYQSAFAMAKTMGATPAHLVKTADHYINVLKHEEKKFGQALVAQRKKQVGGRETQIQQLETGIRQKAEHIKKLTAEIEKDQKTLAQIKSEISGAVVKVETTKNNFVASFNSLVAQIQKDIDNMQKYLK